MYFCKLALDASVTLVCRTNSTTLHSPSVISELNLSKSLEEIYLYFNIIIIIIALIVWVRRCY